MCANSSVPGPTGRNGPSAIITYNNENESVFDVGPNYFILFPGTGASSNDGFSLQSLQGIFGLVGAEILASLKYWVAPTNGTLSNLSVTYNTAIPNITTSIFPSGNVSFNLQVFTSTGPNYLGFGPTSLQVPPSSLTGPVSSTGYSGSNTTSSVQVTAGTLIALQLTTNVTTGPFISGSVDIVTSLTFTPTPEYY